MVLIEVLAPGGNHDTIKMRSVKKYFVYVLAILWSVVPKSPLLIYAKQMLPVPTTLLPEMTQSDLEQLTA